MHVKSAVAFGHIFKFAILVRELFRQTPAVFSLVYFLGGHEEKLKEEFLQG